MLRRSAPKPHPARVLWWLLPALLSACQPQPQSQSEPPHVPAAALDWPGHDYAAAAAAGSDVFLLDPDATQIDVVVRRDGPLARFGHDHVVTVQQAEGFLRLDPHGPGSRADLRLRLDQLTVDSAEARARHALDTDPTEADVAGTRKNLMEHVLDADRWPWMTLDMTAFERQQDHYSAIVTIAVNGSQYSSRQPFRLRREAGRARVEGFFVIRQTELGIEPFSALGGGLRVADPLEIHFLIEADRR
jgi:polyisoprenoid-binding protein YceI